MGCLEKLWMPFSWNIQGQCGWSIEQSVRVKGVPVHGGRGSGGFGTKLSIKAPSKPKLFYDCTNP